MRLGAIAACKAGELQHRLEHGRVLGAGDDLRAQLPGTDCTEGTLLAPAGVA